MVNLPGNLSIVLVTLAGERSEALLFSWGGDRKKDNVKGKNRRNPSSNSLKFPDLFAGKSKHRQHAEMVRLASQIISKVATNNKISNRDIDAALFMWGYDIRTSNPYLSVNS